MLKYGIPAKILTDQGTNFLNNIFKNTCKLVKIEKIQTTAYHPQSNRALDEHRTLAEYLRHYINVDQTDWNKWIPYTKFTYNITPHTSTGFTPYKLIYSHQATIPTSILTPPKAIYILDDYVNEMKKRLRATHQLAKENLKEENGRVNNITIKKRN